MLTTFKKWINLKVNVSMILTKSKSMTWIENENK